MIADGVYRIWVSPSQNVTVRNISIGRTLSHFECKELLVQIGVRSWNEFFTKNRFPFFYDKDNWMFRDFLAENLVKGLSFELIK